MANKPTLKATLVAGADLDSVLANGIPVEAASDNLPALVPDIAEEVVNYRGGMRKANKALAMLALAIKHHWNVPLIALVGKGDNVVSFEFTPGDMFMPRKRKGETTVIAGFLPAAYLRIAEWAGIPEGFIGKETQAYKRAWYIAAADMLLGVDVSWDADGVQMPAAEVFALSEVKDVADKDADGKPITVKREVPTELGAKAVGQFKAASKALGVTLTDEEALAKVKAMPVTLGETNEILKADAPPVSAFGSKFKDEIVACGYDKPDTRSTSASTSDKAAQSLKDSIAMVSKCLTECLAADGDPAHVPGGDMLLSLGALYELIGAFIAQETKADDLVNQMFAQAATSAAQ